MDVVAELVPAAPIIAFLSALLHLRERDRRDKPGDGTRD
jgi:hypothetical protein